MEDGLAFESMVVGTWGSFLLPFASMPNVNDKEPAEKKARYFSMASSFATVPGIGVAVLVGFLCSNNEQI